MKQYPNNCMFIWVLFVGLSTLYSMCLLFCFLVLCSQYLEKPHFILGFLINDVFHIFCPVSGGVALRHFWDCSRKHVKRSTLDQAVLGLRELTRLTPEEVACSKTAWVQMYDKLRLTSWDSDRVKRSSDCLWAARMLEVRPMAGWLSGCSQAPSQWLKISGREVDKAGFRASHPGETEVQISTSTPVNAWCGYRAMDNNSRFSKSNPRLHQLVGACSAQCRPPC